MSRMKNADKPGYYNPFERRFQVPIIQKGQKIQKVYMIFIVIL